MSASVLAEGATADLGARVRDALARVRDPELDEPLTELGFVTACDTGPDGSVRVLLRLPTYFCAPNFAWLMVADAHDAVAGVPGVTSVDVLLEDHFAAAEINRGVAEGAGFAATFAGLAEGELGRLRGDFLRKAVLASTERVCRPLLGAGLDPSELSSLTLADAPPSAERDRLRSRRAELGLPAGDEAPLVVDPLTGDAVEPGAVGLHLRRARLTQVGMEANGAVCRGLLRERYPEVHVEVERSPGRTGR